MAHTIFETNPVEAHGTRDTNAQRHTYPEELPRKKAATTPLSMVECQRPKVRQPKKIESSLLVKHQTLSPHPNKTSHPSALKHLPRTRTKPPCTETARETHVRALPTRTSPTQGRCGMANCTLCRPPSTWLELTNINIVGGPKLLWMVTDKGMGERLKRSRGSRVSRASSRVQRRSRGPRGFERRRGGGEERRSGEGWRGVKMVKRLGVGQKLASVTAGPGAGGAATAASRGWELGVGKKTRLVCW